MAAMAVSAFLRPSSALPCRCLLRRLPRPSPRRPIWTIPPKMPSPWANDTHMPGGMPVPPLHTTESILARNPLWCVVNPFPTLSKLSPVEDLHKRLEAFAHTLALCGGLMAGVAGSALVSPHDRLLEANPEPRGRPRRFLPPAQPVWFNNCTAIAFFCSVQVMLSSMMIMTSLASTPTAAMAIYATRYAPWILLPAALTVPATLTFGAAGVLAVDLLLGSEQTTLCALAGFGCMTAISFVQATTLFFGTAHLRRTVARLAHIAATKSRQEALSSAAVTPH